jgi:hypothetical protein
VVTVEVPSAPPTVVPTASAISGRSMSGRSPSSSRNPPACPTPTSVPAVSKKSTKKNVNTTSAKLNDSMPDSPETNAPASGVMSYRGANASEKSRPPLRTNAGATVPGSTRPTNVTAIPASVVRTMPTTIDPRTPRA